MGLRGLLGLYKSCKVSGLFAKAQNVCTDCCSGKRRNESVPSINGVGAWRVVVARGVEPGARRVGLGARVVGTWRLTRRVGRVALGAKALTYGDACLESSYGPNPQL